MEKLSDYKVKKLSKKIIDSMELYLGGISKNKAKEIIKFGTYCIQYVKGDKIETPSDKLKNIHNEFCRLSVLEIFSDKYIGVDTERRVMKLVQNHFGSDFKDSIWRGGLAYDIFKLKSKGKI